MLMNTMEALGAGPNLSPKGETSGLNLGADAETLALFASLFAMMQAPQQDGATADPVPQAKPQSSETKPLLPAAAMLMAKLAPTAPAGDSQVSLADMLTNDPETGEGEPGDTAGLLKLLLAAQDIAVPDHQPMMLVAASDDNVTAAAPTRTATEMLTGAIEILKSLEVGAMPSGPINETLDQIATPPAAATVLQAGPDLIGPMPAVKPPASPVEQAVLMPAAPDFIGPMPAVKPPASPVEQAVQLPAAPDLIGPMPAVKPPAPPLEQAVLLPAAPDFIGPMPAVKPPASPLEQAVLLPAAPDFIGPMPAVTPPTSLVEQAELLPAAPDFIGPKPVITSAYTVLTADPSNAALNGTRLASAATHTAAKAQAESRSVATVTKTDEPVPHMATIGAA